MSFREQNRFDGRLGAAAEARAAMVARFRDRPGSDDPAVLARGAERRAIVAAREVRNAVRASERLAERERLAEIAALERAAEAAREAAALERAAEHARLEQGRLKAERDARYAARKAKINTAKIKLRR